MTETNVPTRKQRQKPPDRHRRMPLQRGGENAGSGCEVEGMAHDAPDDEARRA
jgi:hypothetical protein